MINVKKKYQFIVYLFFSSLAQAQVSDDFSDGDFTSNPGWSGTVNQFVVNDARQLQLNSSSAGISYLSTPSPVLTLDNFEWQALVRQAFSPSSNNFGRLYLTSSEADLTLPLNGYYLQFGEAGSMDAIELFRQTGLVSTSVCRATPGAISSAFTLKVDVLRTPSGLWQLSVDYSGGTNYKLEAAGIDSTYRSSSYFGILCTYTLSNDTRFYYDDLYAGPALVDTSPPQLLSVLTTSSHNITLTFSEGMDKASSESIANYSADHSLGNPLSASLEPDNKTVNLTFSTDFINGVQNQLTVLGVKDVSGNVIVTNKANFTFFKAFPTQWKDVVITEIFPDPVPQLGLPEAEFIEIYNRSSNPVDVAGWTLSDGLSTAHFPSQIILPKQYWIVASSATAPLFALFENRIPIDPFPSLNNDGDDLVLKNQDGVSIDSVNYSLNWYHDPGKEEGGWSLELIDLNNPCGGEDNWTASEDPRGGTPGTQNSVYASKPDVTGPSLSRVVAVQADRLILTFSEQLDAASITTGSFVVTPVVNSWKANFADQARQEIQLDLAAPLQFRELYTVKVQDVRDCNGNPIQEEFSQLNFSLPEPADSLDILVNEILFNPRSGGVDFVEVYNNSPKYLNLNNWKLAHMENGIPADIEKITSVDYTLAPHAYLVFTSDPAALQNNYPMDNAGNFFHVSLPSLPDDEGSIVILNERGNILDFFLYSKGFHSRLLKDDEGVSLERISFAGSTNESQNWQSASSQVGFATPGYLNSCARPDHPLAPGAVTIEPEIFTPGNGTNDFARIKYRFDQPGFAANIKIVDMQGHLIKTIANNETLGFDGFFNWVGDRDDGSKARVGYYLVWMEVFTITGSVRTFRKRVVVATR